MQLSKTSRAVRWAYLFEDIIPRQTSLCALFWRTVFLSPLKVLAPSTLLLFGLSRFWFYPVESFTVAGVVIAVASAAVIAEKRRERSALEVSEPSVIRDGFKAIKSKVCPIVELIDR